MLTGRLKPSAILLQETLLLPHKLASFSGYNFLRKDSNRDHASGGAALLISKSCMFSEIHLNTQLQAVAARVTLHKTITLCSLYLPPSSSIKISKQDLVHLFDQLPTPFIVMGDLNGHSFQWGSVRPDNRGKIIEDVVSQLDLCILNNDYSPTYIDARSGLPSSLDLSICSPSILLDFSWKVHDDLCGSDHFPTILMADEGWEEEDEEISGRWNMKKANWDLFSELCEIRLNVGEVMSDPDPAAEFTRILTDIAKETVPKSNANKKGPKKPWYNDECKKAHKERKTAQRRAFRNPTPEITLAFRRLRAKARFICKQAAKKSWRQFISSLNSRTPSGKVWKAIRRIRGKGGITSVGHLKVGDRLVTEKKAVADLLANSISRNSSTQHYSQEFQKIKESKETKPCVFGKGDSEEYNKEFSDQELIDAISKSNDSATGLDKVHYAFLRHLPNSSLSLLLDIFNKIWVDGQFPPSWREACIIPIPKPGKDPSNPQNYRPIALTSCLCKTMERMVNARLVWQLESRNLLTNIQCGFRKGHSTTDHLVRFETFIREAFVNRQHVLAVFFDLEKAYDTTWKQGILFDLYDMGFRGRMPTFIQEFLKDRTFRVRVGSTLSNPCDQEMGVPQGSILSPALFSIKINNIAGSVLKGTDASLFVDDFALCVRGATLPRVQRHLQLCVNSVQKWVSENGFKFSIPKTKCVHFTSRRGPFPDPQIVIEGEPITVAQEAKFLGVIFDRKLSFLSHLKYVKARCLKALDVLRVVGHTTWGADKTTLLRLYRALIRSILDYGCVVWGSARGSYLKILDPIHHQGLRICLGAFRTSPVQSLYVEAGEPSLKTRRIQLSLNYVLRLRSYPENPAYKCVFEPAFEEAFEANKKAICPLSLRIRPHLQAAGIDVERIEDSARCHVPPWTLSMPEVIFDLANQKKGDVHPEEFKELLAKALSPGFESAYFEHIYTDGSKSEDGRVAAAAVSMRSPDRPSTLRLLDGCSIYTAELQAILLALGRVRKSKDYNFVILSDSLSALKALDSGKLDHPMLVDIRENLHDLIADRKDIVFVWVPSHVGIRGNSLADQAANRARTGPMYGHMICSQDLRPAVKRYCYNIWQSTWSEQKKNKLFRIRPNLDEILPTCRDSRHEEVVLARLHIGHCYMTHAYLLRDEEKPFCVACNESFTVEHFLISCSDLCEIRCRHYRAADLRSLFLNVPIVNVFDFLRESKLFAKI